MHFGRIALQTITMNYIVARVFISLTKYSTIAVNDTSFVEDECHCINYLTEKNIVWFVDVLLSDTNNERKAGSIRMMKREWRFILLSSKSDNRF